jgi:rare lipoprotein A
VETPKPTPAITPPAPKPEAKPAPKPAPKPEPKAKPEPKPEAKPAAKGAFTVQVGAFAQGTNAQKAAKATGGTVSRAGKLSRVRVGSFATEEEAAAALAKARAAGYTDARIQRTD